MIGVHHEGRRAHGYLSELALATVDALVGIAAVIGGIGLARDGLGMPQEWLLATPFDSWLIPGLLLAVGIGGSQLAAAALLVLRDEDARGAAVVAAGLLVAWIVVQVMVLRRFHLMQPAMFAVGIGTWAWAKHLPRPTPR